MKFIFRATASSARPLTAQFRTPNALFSLEDAMSRKTVLVAGATGVVGHAAMQHFSAAPETDVIAVSRREPDHTYGARFVGVDLRDQARCAEVFSSMGDVTHLVYAALFEKPDLAAGWLEEDQIRINDQMFRNILDPLLRIAKSLRHVTLLQGTKAYGIHARPMAIPAREDRSEARDVPNFYWNQEDYLRERQAGQNWSFTILRPVLIIGHALGAAMNLIPALGVYGAILKERGEPLYYPGGPDRVAQAVDADLLAKTIGWSGEADAARNEIFNVTNGDVFSWPTVWPALADAMGMPAGEKRSISMAKEIAPREEEWRKIVARHHLVAPDLKSFVGLSFQYADMQLGYGRTQPGPTVFSSTIKLMRAGFHEVMDTEEMFVRWIRSYQEKRLLPR
jgi:nucleoside-diphosphate-sugar epimerase